MVKVQPDVFFQEAANNLQPSDNRESFMFQLEKYIKVLADILEALIGAMFVDSGLNYHFMRQVLLKDSLLGWMLHYRVQSFLSERGKKGRKTVLRSHLQDHALQEKKRIIE